MLARVLIGSTLFAGVVLLGIPTVAFADDPVDLGGASVLDDSGVLGSRAGDVRDALDTLYSDTGAKLFVVYVPTFTNPADAQSWADQSATASGLGNADMLLAIATDDHVYALSTGADFPVSDGKINDAVNNDLLPALRGEDWSGGAIAYADGLRAAQAPSPVPAIVGGVVVVGVGTGIVVGVVRSRRTKKKVKDAAAAEVSALDQKAGVLLVQLDDALKTSEQELGFAQAQFGDAQTKDFVAALADAKSLAKQAFQLQQKLDDAFPETPEQHKTMTEQLVQLAQQADAVLEAQAESFDQLRQLQKNAPQVLEQVASDQTGLEARIAAAASTIAELTKTYPHGDLSSLSGLPAQARKLASFAASTVTAARKVLSSAKGAEDAGAAVAVRAAQQAGGQVEQLLASVDRVKSDLAAQAARDAATTAQLDSQLTDARSHIGSAQDYITTHRGAVGATARTRISEASRHLDTANGLATSDPAKALGEAQQAEQLAAAAFDLASTDVSNAESVLSPPHAQAPQNGFDGAILGGILGGLFGDNGSSGSSSGSSWWGPSSSGSSGSGGIFGGSSGPSSSGGIFGDSWSGSGGCGGSSHHSSGGGMFGGASGSSFGGSSSGSSSSSSGRRGSSGRF
ncbi:TPM domain-containing protein [soil metagenome]